MGYNYRINLDEKSLLSFGIKMDYGMFRSNYLDLEMQDYDDIIVANNTLSKNYLNFGAGLFFQTKK